MESMIGSTGHSGCARLGARQTIHEEDDLFCPPESIYELTKKPIKWNWEVRERTLRLKNTNPILLKASLRRWGNAAIAQSPGGGLKRISTKRLGDIIYGLRGLKVGEFVELVQAEDFAGALYKLTGSSVGHRWQEAVAADRGPKRAPRASRAEERNQQEGMPGSSNDQWLHGKGGIK